MIDIKIRRGTADHTGVGTQASGGLDRQAGRLLGAALAIEYSLVPPTCDCNAPAVAGKSRIDTWGEVHTLSGARFMFRFPMEIVTIDGFRGLRKLSLQQLGQINLLVGPNNSGKTSVLEAMSIFCHAHDPLEWLWTARCRDMAGTDETRIQSVRWCFPRNGDLARREATLKGACKIFCGGALSLSSLRANYREIQELPTQGADSNLEGGSVPVPQRFVDGAYLDVEPRRGFEITHRIEFGNPVLLGPRTVEDPIVIRVWDDDALLEHHPSPTRGLMRVETLTPASYQIGGLHGGNHCCEGKIPDTQFSRRSSSRGSGD